MNVRTSIAIWAPLAFGALTACGPTEQGGTDFDATLREQLRTDSEVYAGYTVADLRGDDAALELAQQLFATNCAGCHGDTAEGKQGVMNLVDGVFNYGNSVDAIRMTITDGRHSVMPGMGSRYGEMNLGQLVAYVESLASDEPLERLATQGKQLYDETCAACHGPDGRGMPELGAPNLADAYWLHGDTMMAIRLLITRGAEGDCPPQSQTLTPVEIELLTAYVAGLNES